MEREEVRQRQRKSGDLNTRWSLWVAFVSGICATAIALKLSSATSSATASTITLLYHDSVYNALFPVEAPLEI